MSQDNKKKDEGSKIWIFALLGGGGLIGLSVIAAVVFGIIMVGALLQHEEDENFTSGGFGGMCRQDGSVEMSTWDSVFSSSQSSGALAGYGDKIISLSQQNGIDPILVAAVMLHETGRGKSNAIQNYNNPGGIMDFRSGHMRLRRFSSLDEGLTYTIENLKRRIIDDGLNTIEKLGSVYAPIGAANDPTGLNNHWVPNITEMTNNLGGLTMNCENVVTAGNETLQVILEEMFKYNGDAYVWAGFTPQMGFDCSGLMQWAFKKAGISLPRTSYEQYKFAQPVTKDQLQPGDLIFFKTASYNPVTHVGIYLGNNQMFDANNSGVGYSSPFDSYWGPKIVGYGRIADFTQ